MSDPETLLAAKIALIKQEFVVKLRADWLPNLRTLRQGFANSPFDTALCDSLMRAAHNMTGSGAVFGFDAISTNGRELENKLRSMAQDGTASDADHRDVIALIDQLDAACVAALGDASTDGVARD